MKNSLCEAKQNLLSFKEADFYEGRETGSHRNNETSSHEINGSNETVCFSKMFFVVKEQETQIETMSFSLSEEEIFLLKEEVLAVWRTQ